MSRNVVITVNIVKMVSTVAKIVAMIVAKIGVSPVVSIFDILYCLLGIWWISVFLLGPLGIWWIPDAGEGAVGGG